MKGIPPLFQRLCLLSLWVLAAWPARSFQPETETALNANPEWYAEFGASVAVSGNTVVVGAPGSFAGGSFGAAFVFVKGPDGWVQEATLASDLSYANRFGQSVAISGDTVVVGDPSHVENGIMSGAVHVFIREAGRWSLQAKLLPGDRLRNQKFGCAVAVEGDRVAVGAKGDSGVLSASGAVYVFAWTGTAWLQEAKLKADPEYAGDSLGIAVALRGSTVIAGAPGHDLPSKADVGAVYVFALGENGWLQQQILTAGDEVANSALLGTSVALADDLVLAGAPLDDAGGVTDSGGAYLFARTTAGGWETLGRLVPEVIAPNAKFGQAVALQGKIAAIGASDDSSFGQLAGAVVLFEDRDLGWQQTWNLGANEPVSGARFGSAVALETEQLMVGAPWLDWPSLSLGLEAGQGYVYESNDPPPPLNTPPVADASATATDAVSNNGLDATVILDGSNSTDADGDALTYSWATDGIEIATGPVTEVVLGIGVHEISLTVNDGQDSAMASVTITVRAVNQSPVADASASVTQAISPNNRDARVLLDGSASSDPDGDALAFAWFEGDKSLGTGVRCETRLPLGPHRVTLRVDDGQAAAEASVEIKVITAGQATREVRALAKARSLRGARKMAALALLENAARFFDRGRMRWGVAFLRLSQRMLDLPGKHRMKSNEADDLIAAIQEIIDAVTAR